MSVHNFTKALHQKTIKNALLADSKFAPNLKTCCLTGTDKILIEFNLPLTGSEALRLSTMVSNLPINDPSLLVDINLQKIAKFVDKLIKKYGKKNTLRGYTTAQVRQVNADLSEVMSLLNGKALPTVLDVLKSFVPTLEIPQKDLNEFIVDITDFLVKL